MNRIIRPFYKAAQCIKTICTYSRSRKYSGCSTSTSKKWPNIED